MSSEIFDFLFEREDYKAAEDQLRAALFSNDVNAQKSLKEELFPDETNAVWKSEPSDFSVEDLLGSYFVENDLPSAGHIKEENFEPFKDLVSLPFDPSFMESLDTAGLEAASDSGLSNDNIAEMMLSPSSGATSPDPSGDISIDTIDAISDVSSTSDLGSMGSVGSSPNGGSRISFTSPTSLDADVEPLISHYDDDVDMNDFQVALNSASEKVSVSSSVTRKPVVTSPQYSIKLSSSPTIISTSATQQKPIPPSIATRSIKLDLAQPTRIVKSVAPISHITTSTAATKAPILKKLRLDTSSVASKVTATSTATKTTSPQTIVVTQAGKSTPLLRNGALLKTGNGTSFLLPVNVNDLNQVRTIKIISAGSNASANRSDGTSNVRTLVSTVRPTTTNPNASQSGRATYYTTSKGSDGRSLLKVTPTALVSPTTHTDVSHRRVNPSYTRDDQSDDDTPHPNQELALNDEERKLMRKEGIVLPSRYPLTKQEERDLKRIRRKIRNKISAQDSRKRKKEYVDGLEDRVKTCTDENQQLQKRIKTLEKHNESLMAQMKKFQSLIGGSFQHRPHTHTSTALMMLILSAALFVVPSLRSQDSKAENELAGRNKMPPAGHSRSLLEAKHALNIQHMEGFTPADEDDIDPLSFSNALSDHDYAPVAKHARMDNLIPFLNPSDKTMGRDKGDPPDTIGGLNGVASLIGAVFDRLGRNWTDSGGRYGGAVNSTPPHSLPERSSVVVNLNHGRRMRDDIELE